MRLQLPPEFLQCEEGKFAGGVERAFMSTTKCSEVAFVRQPCLKRGVFVCCAKGLALRPGRTTAAAARRWWRCACAHGALVTATV